MKPDQLNEGHFLEALHTTFVLHDTFSRHLYDHPAISGNRKLKVMAEKISDLMGDLYQEIPRQEDLFIAAKKLNGTGKKQK